MSETSIGSRCIGAGGIDAVAIEDAVEASNGAATGEVVALRGSGASGIGRPRSTRQDASPFPAAKKRVPVDVEEGSATA